MIKAGATDKDGKPIIILGLSDANLAKLREGKPIAVDLALFGLVGTVFIMHGATEQDIARELTRIVEIPS